MDDRGRTPRDQATEEGAAATPAPGQVAAGAAREVAALTDRERGLLASALLAACGGTAEATPVVTQLRLDSADPSPMSRADVARLLAHLRATDAAALRHALRTFGERPEMVATLDGLFAPSRERSDTGTLGGDPASGGATRGS